MSAPSRISHESPAGRLGHAFRACQQPIPPGADEWANRVCTALLKEAGIIGAARK